MDDDQLVQRGMRGDGDAFDLLFQRYHRFICGIIYPIVRNQQDTEDIAGSTWKKAWETLSTLRDGSSFKYWLTTIAKNAARDHLRRDRWRNGRDEEEEELVDPEDIEGQVTTQIVFEEAQKAAFKKMRPVQRKCFTYRIQGWTIEDVAKQLNLAEGSVRTYVSDAYRILRSEFRKRLDGDQNDERFHR
jgi:RNA polymerase sigma-70 factor (ECF subfamily)